MKRLPAARPVGSPPRSRRRRSRPRPPTTSARPRRRSGCRRASAARPASPRSRRTSPARAPSCAARSGTRSSRPPARQVVRLAAQGDLDAVVDVFQRTRSQLATVGCDVGNSRGQAEVTFRTGAAAGELPDPGRPARQLGAGRLPARVFTPQPPPRPPGPALPPPGSRARVNSRATRATRSRPSCAPARPTASTAPGERLHDARALRAGDERLRGASPVDAGCGGYFLFTPGAGEGGRYSLLVTAQPRRRGDQRYHLQVARASEDDTSPGLPLANYERARGIPAGQRRRRGRPLPLLARAAQPAARQPARRRLPAAAAARQRPPRRRQRRRRDRAPRGRGATTSRCARRARSRAATSCSARRARSRTRASHQRRALGGRGAGARCGRRALRPPAPGPYASRSSASTRSRAGSSTAAVRRASNGDGQLAFTPPFAGALARARRLPGTRDAAPSATGFSRLLVASPP